MKIEKRKIQKNTENSKISNKIPHFFFTYYLFNCEYKGKLLLDVYLYLSSSVFELFGHYLVIWSE